MLIMNFQLLFFKQLCSVFSSSFSCPPFLSSPVKCESSKNLIKTPLMLSEKEVRLVLHRLFQLNPYHFFVIFWHLQSIYSSILPKKWNLNCWGIASHCFCSSLKQTNQPHSFLVSALSPNHEFSKTAAKVSEIARMARASLLSISLGTDELKISSFSKYSLTCSSLTKVLAICHWCKWY